jgi:hypothetical protein
MRCFSDDFIRTHILIGDGQFTLQFTLEKFFKKFTLENQEGGGSWTQELRAYRTLIAVAREFAL